MRSQERAASHGYESGATRMSTTLPATQVCRAWASESAQSGPRLRSVVPVVEATMITTTSVARRAAQTPRRSTSSSAGTQASTSGEYV